jgi:hypothetical protein
MAVGIQTDAEANRGKRPQHVGLMFRRKFIWLFASKVEGLFWF